ncbi:MAG TPA: hypothetical protein DGT58_06050, partial [Erysipelotrichaceae bacterium]|nr:hypothetical protein [Erysipelotrichaceae bacterium]
PADTKQTSHLNIVTVYQDSNDNIEDMTIVPFDLADVTDTYHTYAAGPDADDGFGINTEYTAQDMNEAVT